MMWDVLLGFLVIVSFILGVVCTFIFFLLVKLAISDSPGYEGHSGMAKYGFIRTKRDKSGRFVK